MICVNVYSENCILNTRYDVIFSDYINSHLNTQLKLPKSFSAIYLLIRFECIFVSSQTPCKHSIPNKKAPQKEC